MSSTYGDMQYGEQVLKVEPYGVLPVRDSERHGRAGSQFTLWLGANLTIADFALGFLPISLGLPWSWTIVSIIVGNIIGAIVVGACAAMGPTYGVPQLIIGRFTFGRVGGYLPAILNYVSTIGWFTVNNILGAFGLRVLFPQLAFWQGAMLLVVIQGLLAIYGHNLIHTYERIMSVVLGILFLIATVIAISHHTVLTAYHPAVAASYWPPFAIMVAAAFSYIGSWGSYASDYSRYLHKETPKRKIIRNAFWGSFIASVWLELVGSAVAVLAPKATNNISALHSVMGAFGTLAVIGIILGGTAADALNLYSNSLSAGALDIKLPRWVLAGVAAIIGLILSLAGAGQFEHNFENFLLLLGYWMTPWLGVLFVDFYLFKSYRHASQDRRNSRSIGWAGILSFLIGIVVSIPFMSSTLYSGWVASKLHGADLTFYVGFIVACLAYWIIARNQSNCLQ